MYSPSVAKYDCNPLAADANANPKLQAFAAVRCAFSTSASVMPYIKAAVRVCKSAPLLKASSIGADFTTAAR